MNITVNWLGLLLVPLWIVAFIKTWNHPVFWVILILAIKDLKITTKCKR